MAKVFYVYLHRRADNNEIFYVGKGSGQRAGQRVGRSDYWKRVVAKSGLIVEIIEYWPNESDALAQERYLIESFRALGLRLCNLTDGGDGISGYVFSDEQKKARSEYLSRPDVKEKHIKNTAIAMQRPGVKERTDAARRAALSRPGIKEKHSKALSQAMRGKAFTEAHKLALSASYNKLGVRELHGEKIKASYQKPGVRDRRKAVNAEIRSRPEVREAFLEAVRSDAHREKQRLKTLEAMNRPEVKERHRIAMKLWQEKRRLERLATA